MPLCAVVLGHCAGLPLRVVVVGTGPAGGVDGLLRTGIEEGLGEQGLVQPLRVGGLRVAEAPDVVDGQAVNGEAVNGGGEQGLEVDDFLAVKQQVVAVLLQVYLEDGVVRLAVVRI